MSEIVSTIVGPARLYRTGRKTLSISVHPDGEVELRAPEQAPLEDVLAKVAKRAAWIRRQRRAFTEMHAKRPPRRYVSGATHRYLGRQYRLKVKKGRTAGVKLLGGYFRVTTPSPTESEVERLLSLWMRERARDQFTRRLERWRPWCAQRRLPPPRLHLRNMPKRWGSAHKDGRIYMNPELIRAPSICVDYVIVHEICHLKHPHHGPPFHRLLGQLAPEWREAKRRLESLEL